MRRRLVTLAWLVVVFVPLVNLAQTEPSRGGMKQVTYASLERYWNCMERNDLQAIKELLWQHKNVERIDASIWGLPKDDLDDHQLLTIDERIWYRKVRLEANNPLPDHGPIIYPHFLREALDHLYVSMGQRPDCGKLLKDMGLNLKTVETLLGGWATDKNIVTDTSNARGEVNIVVDKQNEARVFASSVQPVSGAGGTSCTTWRSTNWGATFTQGNVGNNSGSTWECDPCGYYQRSVNPSKMYFSKIGCQTGQCASTFVMMRYSTDNGQTFSDCGRPDTATNSDRQWHTVDNTATSPCYGRIYLTWHNGNAEQVAVSSDSCSTWTKTQLTSGGSITPDITTAADGHVYVTWGNYGDSTFKMAGSSDCGATWNAPSNTTIKAYNGAWSNNIPAQCQRGIATEPKIDVDRCPWSAFLGRVYVLMADYNTTGTDLGCNPIPYNNPRNYDLWFSYSTNNGATWTPAVNLTSGEGSAVDDFQPFMRVDEADGSIYVAWQRSRLNPANLADRQTCAFWAMRSIDGGATWSTPYQVSSYEGNEELSGGSSFEHGDYQGADVYDGVLWPVWIDRRGATSTNPEQVVTRKVCTEPAHKSERAPTFTAPPTTVSAGANKVINVSWTAPDIYWGDANENNSARKYQLYVDGTLNQDNLLWTSTSTTYTASDCTTSHTFTIRAINQCGIYKDYATATATAAGCCPTNPTSVDVIPNGPLSLCPNASQLLSVSITGPAGPFTYQWTRDGASIPGATSSAYTVTDVGTHSYNCTVTGSGCGAGVQDASATRIIRYPPFSGVSSVSNAQSSSCTLTLSWSAATACSGDSVYYSIYRSTTPFTPSASSLVATRVAGTTYTDNSALSPSVVYYYIVRAFYGSNGEEDPNVTTLSSLVSGVISSASYTDTMEAAPPSGLTRTADANWYQTTNCTAHSASATYHFGADPNTGGKKCQMAGGIGPASYSVTYAVTLPAGGDLVSTRFWHTLQGLYSGSTYDYAYLEIDPNNDGTWSTIASWRGDSNITSMTQTPAYDLSSYNVGRTSTIVGIRFRYAVAANWNCGGCSQIGWNIDDFTVSYTSPAACTTVPVPPAVPSGILGKSAMTASKLSGDGSSVQLTWDTTCKTTGDRFKVLYGYAPSLPALTSGSYGLSGVVCQDGSSNPITTSPFSWSGVPAVDPATQKFLWWVMVESNSGGSTEGPWGQNSDGYERSGPGSGGSSGSCGASNKTLANTCGR